MLTFFSSLVYSQTFKSGFKNGILNEDKNCKAQLVCITNDINLGTFTNGFSGSDLPAKDGTNNYLEYMLTGSGKSEYQINATFNNNTSGNNLVLIDKWTWEFMDSNSPGSYSNPINNLSSINRNVKLIKSGNNNCDSFAKIRLTLNHLTISQSAQKGSYNFVITISFIDM
jgi:hypothetical protein